MPPKMDRPEEKKEAPKKAVADEGKEEKKEHKEVKTSVPLKKKPFVIADHLAELKANRITTLDLSDQGIVDEAKAHQATLTGHAGGVSALAALPDGRLASSSDDNSIRLWDIDQNTCVATLTGHTDRVWTLAVLPDGHLASGSRDYSIRLWDMDKKTCVATLTGHTSSIFALAVLPDGRLASGSGDFSIRLWDTDKKTCVSTLTGYTDCVYALAVLPDGRLASGSADHSIRLWDMDQKTCVATLTGHNNHVTALAVLLDGRLTSGSSDHSIRLWDTDKKTCVATLRGNTSIISALSVLPNGRLASGCQNKSRLWDMDKKTCVATLTGHTQRVTALAVLSDGRLASSSDDRSIRLWTVMPRTLTYTDAQPLLTALQTNTSVNILNLQTVRLEETSVTGLLDLLHSNPRLTELNLQHTGLSLEALRTLYTSTRDRTPSLTLRHELMPTLEAEITEQRRTEAEAKAKADTAWVLLIQRAQEGDATAQYDVAVCYQEGKGIPKDEKAGIEWYRKSAVQGNSQAQYALGCCYDKGTGIPANEATAIKWYHKAALQQHLGARQRLLELGEDLPAPERVADLSSSSTSLISGVLKSLPRAPVSDNLLLASTPTSYVPLSEPRSILAKVPTVPAKSESKVSIEESKSAPSLEFSTSWLISETELTLGKKLGSGGYGVVYQGIRHPHIDVAIKQLLIDTVSEETVTEFKKEALIMANLHSPYTVHFYGYSVSPHCRLVMEYMPKGSLYSVLHSKEVITPETTYRIITDIACGVAFLHSQHILHRDLKSLNVLLDKHYSAKLCDFGLAKIKTETRTSLSTKGGSVGTLAWMAPELVMKKKKSESKEIKAPQDPFTTKADIYSMGITFWEVVARKHPFADAPSPMMIPLLAAQGERDDIPESCSPKLASLISHCWDTDPAKRPTAEEVANFLRSAETEFKPAAVRAAP